MTVAFPNIEDAVQLCRDIRKLTPPLMEELGRLTAIMLRQAEAVNKLCTVTDDAGTRAALLELVGTNMEVREVDTELFTMLGVQN